MRRLAVVLLSAAFAACSSSGDDGAPAGPADPGAAPEKECADGFTVMEGGAGCAPILPAAACAPGTRASLGSDTCAPVGNAACAPGFVPHASGWGCDAVVAPARCTGATRERLGSTACAPISDCNAPFPPPGATLFVKAGYADGELDATHFRTIADALAAAPAGATIAVDTGAYGGATLEPKHDVTVVGRCAEQVVLTSADGKTSAFSMNESAHVNVTLKNMTLRGWHGAVGALSGHLDLEGLLIEDSKLAGIVVGNASTTATITNVVVRGTRGNPGEQNLFGLFATFGAKVDVSDSVFADNDFINVGFNGDGTVGTLTRSIVRDGHGFGTTGNYGMGAYAADGAQMTIEESAIVDNRAAGVNAYSATPKVVTRATLRRSVVRGTLLDSQSLGRGLETNAGVLEVEQSTVADSAQIDAMVAAGGKATFTNVTLLGTSNPDPAKYGPLGLVTDDATTTATSLAIVGTRIGGQAQGTGSISLADSLVAKTRFGSRLYEEGQWIGIGLLVESKATLDLARTTIEQTRTSALVALGHAKLDGVVVRGTRAANDGFAGRGISVQAGGVTDVARSAISDNTEAGVLVANGGATLTMTESSIDVTDVDPAGQFGIGIIAGGTANATVEKSTITASKGIGLAFAGAGGTLRACVISKNAVALHAQEGTTIVEGDGDGDPTTLAVSKDTRFVDNQTRIGSGEVPIPRVLDPKARPSPTP